MAKQHSVIIVCGMNERDDGLSRSTLYNTVVVVGPDGDTTAGPMRQEVGVLYADVDLSAVGVTRRSQDVAGHYSRPDLFELRVKSEPQKPFALE